MKQKAVNRKLQARRDALKTEGNPNISEYGDGKRIWVRAGSNKIVCMRRPGSRQRH